MPGLPNLLSLLRIALIPFLIFCLADTGPGWSLLAAGIFFIASLTDFFDGYMARRQGRATLLGTFLDPLADKLIVAAALVMLAAADRFPRVPAWLVVVILAREIAVTGLRSVAAGEGLVLPADRLGKYKTLFQLVALHGLIVHYTYVHVNFHVMGMYFLWIAAGLGVWSGIAYHVRVGRHLAGTYRKTRPPDGIDPGVASAADTTLHRGTSA